LSACARIRPWSRSAYYFFFSSRRRHTRSNRDWSSDVCSSDLDYVEELVDIADLDGDIDIEVRNNRTYLSVLAPDDDEEVQGLVGKDGKTLEALQELTRLAVL